MTGAVTTMPVAAPLDADADVRWQAWQARGADGDRRRAGTMGWVSVLMVLTATAWLLLQVLAS